MIGASGWIAAASCTTSLVFQTYLALVGNCLFCCYLEPSFLAQSMPNLRILSISSFTMIELLVSNPTTSDCVTFASFSLNLVHVTCIPLSTSSGSFRGLPRALFPATDKLEASVGLALLCSHLNGEIVASFIDPHMRQLKSYGKLLKQMEKSPPPPLAAPLVARDGEPLPSIAAHFRQAPVPTPTLGRATMMKDIEDWITQ
ncbi:hypothetical protein HAX54_030233 [Datura stramonium]|uniref:Uncharacterized protein n=1 Tax=Datura stramonium TaxID=4076 RepID=A0ABS8SAW1_DATST|nr:hypothetical protein [Datura stramonium]